MFRWFLFLAAIVLFVLGSVLAGLVLTTPMEEKKEEDDE